MIDPDFDPLNDLRVAEHNIGQLVQAYNSQQTTLKSLISRHNEQELHVTDLVQQHVMVVETLKAIRTTQEQMDQRLRAIEVILTEMRQ